MKVFSYKIIRVITAILITFFIASCVTIGYSGGW